MAFSLSAKSLYRRVSGGIIDPNWFDVINKVFPIIIGGLITDPTNGELQSQQKIAPNLNPHRVTIASMRTKTGLTRSFINTIFSNGGVKLSGFYK